MCISFNDTWAIELNNVAQKNKTTCSLSWVFTWKLKLFNICTLNFPYLHVKFFVASFSIIFSSSSEIRMLSPSQSIPSTASWLNSFYSAPGFHSLAESQSIRPFGRAQCTKSLMVIPPRTQTLENIYLPWKYELPPFIQSGDLGNAWFSLSTAAKNLKIPSATQTLSPPLASFRAFPNYHPHTASSFQGFVILSCSWF